MKSRIRQNTISDLAPSILIGGRSGYIFFITVSLILFGFAIVNPSSLSGVRATATDTISPVLSSFGKPFQALVETISGVSGVAALRAENAQLKAENVRLKEWYQTALMLSARNQSLQELLNLKSDPVHSYITARVISDAGNAFVKTVLVNVGKEQGVAKNQAVISGEGMLGRVVEVSDKFSRVLLLSDVNSRVPVIVENSNQKAVLAGNNGKFMKLRYLPQDSSLVEGARIVTSGHGGIFPVGLPVGRVIKGANDEFVVKSYADLSRVNYVRIVKVPVDNNLVTGNLTASHE